MAKNNKDKKKILVIGGAGYVGHETCLLLKKKGYDVCILDNLSRGWLENTKGFKLFIADLRDRDSLNAVFKKNKFIAVIHFASLIFVDESMNQPCLYFENNVIGTINLLNAMSEFGVKQLIFSSSAAVYGNSEKIPIDEDDKKYPLSPYGEAKLIIERLLPWYEQKFQLRHISLRYFNACGAALDGKSGEAHRPEKHIIPLLIRVALGKKKDFSLYGIDYPTIDGSCVRDYVHVVDLARAHLASLKYLSKGGESNYFNVGTGKGYSNWEVINTVKKVTGVDFKVTTAPRRKGDPDILIANNQKIMKLLAWKPRYSDLETIIKTAYKWHRDHLFSLED